MISLLTSQENVLYHEDTSKQDSWFISWFICPVIPHLSSGGENSPDGEIKDSPTKLLRGLWHEQATDTLRCFVGKHSQLFSLVEEWKGELEDLGNEWVWMTLEFFAGIISGILYLLLLK